MDCCRESILIKGIKYGKRSKCIGFDKTIRSEMSASKGVLPTTLFFIAKAEWSIRAVADDFIYWVYPSMDDGFSQS